MSDTDQTEDEQRRDRALKRLLNSPPTPHNPKAEEKEADGKRPPRSKG